MLEVKENKLMFTTVENEFINLYPITMCVEDINKFNDSLTFLLSQFLTVKYYYDFFELLISVRTLLSRIDCEVHFIFKDSNRNKIDYEDFLSDYYFLEVYSCLFSVNVYTSKPRDLSLNFVLNSCKI